MAGEAVAKSTNYPLTELNKLNNDISTAFSAIIEKFKDLRSELKVGKFISQNLPRITVLTADSNKRDSFFQFSKVGKGAYGECFLVTPNENAPEDLKSLGNFLVKQIENSEEIYEETARVLLMTLLGHYGLVESHTVEMDVNGQMKKVPLVLFEYDSSQNITVYITMKYIEGKQLSEAIEKKELSDYDRLRIAVRIADTMNFLHSYKLAHCDLSCENIMLTQGTNDPILIDFGNMRAGGDFSMFDTSSYHAMIFMMYRDVNKIPPVVKPMFDKWDDESSHQMSFKDITDKYFNELSAYHAMVSVVDGATQSSNTVPVKRVGGFFMIDFEAMGKSSSFTEYMEQTGISLAEQDEKIKNYLANH